MMSYYAIESDGVLNGQHALELFEQRVKACKEGT